MGTQKASSIGFAGYTGYVIGLSLAMTMTTSAFAKSKKSAPAPQPAPTVSTPIPAMPATKGEDKVDISDLESKYWAPKDTDFSVVQNRTYAKEHRFLITPQFGTPINDAHSEGNIFGGTANYFWSERMGVQLTYLKGDLRNNSATRDVGRLSASGGARPDFDRFSSYYGIGYNIVPFYAKMSFWGKRIIYFDMAFTPTVGMTTYEQQIEGGNKEKSAFTYGIDVTQYFFFSRWFAIRADLKNQFSQQEIVKYRGTTIGQKVTDKNTQDTMFLLGATFYW